MIAVKTSAYYESKERGDLCEDMRVGECMHSYEKNMSECKCERACECVCVCVCVCVCMLIYNGDGTINYDTSVQVCLHVRAHLCQEYVHLTGICFVDDCSCMCSTS